MINSNRYVEIDDITMIPTSKVVPVSTDEVFDFRTAKALNSNWSSLVEKLPVQQGYNHTWVLSNDMDETMHQAAQKLVQNYDIPSNSFLHFAGVLQAPSGEYESRKVSIFTTQPGFHIYTANYAKDKAPFHKYGSIAIETQFPTDAINQSWTDDEKIGPSMQRVLSPSDKYQQFTFYKIEY